MRAKSLISRSLGAGTASRSPLVGHTHPPREPGPYLLVFAFVLVMVAPLAGALIRYQYRSTLEIWNMRESNLADDRSHVLTDWLKERSGDAQTLATRPEVIAALSELGLAEAGGRDAKALTTVLETYEHAYPYVSVYVLDAAGRPVSATAGAWKLPESLREIYRARAETGGVGFDFVDFPQSMAISISTPVFAESASSGQRRALGAVALLGELDQHLYPLLLWESVPTFTGETMLVRKAGDQVEYISPQRQLGTSKAGMRRSYQKPGPAAQAALSGKEGFGEFVDHRGVPVLAATRRIKLTGWGLITKIDRTEAFHDFRRLAWVEGLAAVVLVAVFGGLLVVYRRYAESAAEKKERKNELRRFRALVEAAAQILWTTNRQGEVEDVPAWRAFTGQTVEEVRGWGWLEALHPEDRDRTAAIWSEAVRNLSLFSTEYRLRRHDGEYRHFSVRGVPARDSDGRVHGWVGFCRDIHGHKLAQEALRERELQLRLLLDSTAEGIYGLDLDGCCTFCNAAALRLLGYGSPEDLIGKPMHTIIHSRKSDGSVYPLEECRIHRAFREGAASHVSDEVLWRAGGTSFPAEYWSHPIRREGIVLGAVVTFIDITDRRRAEESARQLAGQLLTSQDDERRRIARELHDSAGQALAALAINLERLRESSALLDQRTKDLFDDSRALLEGLSDELRSLSHLLHPPLLDEVGLPAALQWYVDEFEKRSGIITHLELAADVGRLPADFEIAIFRIVQEALTNVHHHSGSREADVRLVRSNGEVRLEIADAGKGIPPEKRANLATGEAMGIGLRGMRERVAQLGGTWSLQSNGCGTTVSVTLPT